MSHLTRKHRMGELSSQEKVITEGHAHDWGPSVCHTLFGFASYSLVEHKNGRTNRQYIPVVRLILITPPTGLYHHIAYFIAS